MATAKIRIGLACGLAVALAPGVASANDDYLIMNGRHRNFDSPQNFAFEFRGALYRPDVDSEPGLEGSGKTPYQSTFGDSRRALLGIEFDWQALRIPHVGVLGPGLSLSYTAMSGATRGVYSRLPSGESTKLQIIPASLLAVFRLDVLTRELGIPFIPYAKFGVSYAYWRSYSDDGLDHASEPSDPKSDYPGRGGTLGTQLSLGMAFNMNVFDQGAARAFDETLGVNRTTLFIEYVDMNLHGLGEEHPLRLGDKTFAFGLGLEF